MTRKYRNVPQIVGSESYRSKRELERHRDLLIWQLAGEIAGIAREVAFELAPSVTIHGRKRPPLRYLADFVYTDVKTGKVIVEDAKGVRTEGYRIKRHLMKSVHGIDIVET